MGLFLVYAKRMNFLRENGLIDTDVHLSVGQLDARQPELTVKTAEALC